MLGRFLKEDMVGNRGALRFIKDFRVLFMLQAVRLINLAEIGLSGEPWVDCVARRLCVSLLKNRCFFLNKICISH